MVRSDSLTLDSLTGAALRLLRFRPEAGEPRGILLVQHGLAEHAGRYRRVGEELAAKGFAVFAHDHRGHGSTTAPDAPLRRFAGRDGVAKVLRDTHAVRLHAASEHPGVPVALFGHSMGGLVALDYARRYGEGLAALLVWNIATDFGWKGRAGAAALRAERALKGSDVASAVFARATFESWNRRIPDRRTEADWLSHDAEAVRRYLDDPLCGWTPTVSMAEDVLEMVRDASTPACLSEIPHRVPVQVLGGAEDPSVDGGAATARLAGRLREAGSRHVEEVVVPGARHETLNETEPMRGEALEALVAFLEAGFAAAPVRPPARRAPA